MIKYKTFSEMRKIDGADCEVYGISAFSEQGRLLASVCDITHDRQKAERLATLCEGLGLSPLHLKDVTEDYIISDRY